MGISSFLFLSVWWSTITAYRVPSSCDGGKKVCFEREDHGTAFVFNPDTKKYEVICHDGWDRADADVACKMAGFKHGALQESRDHDSHGLDFYMDEVDCIGTETDLIGPNGCKHNQRNDCGSNQAAGAICDSATGEDLEKASTSLEECFASKVSFSANDQIGGFTYESTSVHCQERCAKNPDCVQFSYRKMSKRCHLFSASSKEANPYEVGGPPQCPDETIVQDKLKTENCQDGTCLIGGKNETEGNVFHEGQAVCDDHWGEKEASVVCRELGYNGQVLRFTSASQFGLVPKPKTGETLKCNGTEESLVDCAIVPSRLECDSGEGAGVVCDTRSLEVVEKEKECFIRRTAYQMTSSGGRLLRVKEGLLTAADCQSLCKDTSSCSHFTWFFSGGKCHLFTFSQIQGEREIMISLFHFIFLRGEQASG